ncbi:MAG: hypothetical protein ACKVZJ_13860 [Phycisphaerales bacterium]
MVLQAARVMLGKLALLILVAACTAAGVLAIRQQRLVAMHDMARSVERSAELDRKLWRIRADIAELITPGRVRTMVEGDEGLGDLGPIPIYWNPPSVDEQMKDPTLLGSGPVRNAPKPRGSRSNSTSQEPRRAR